MVHDVVWGEEATADDLVVFNGHFEVLVGECLSLDGLEARDEFFEGLRE
jgi:hypothetical protein